MLTGPFPRRPSPRPVLPPGIPPGRGLLQESPSRMVSGNFLFTLTPTPVSELPSQGLYSQGWVSLGISFSKTPEGARFSL